MAERVQNTSVVRANGDIGRSCCGHVKARKGKVGLSRNEHVPLIRRFGMGSFQ